MKKTTATLTSALGLVLGSLNAQTVPPYINYQGKVTDSSGDGLGTGTPVNRKVIFRVFDAPSGGNRLWSEQHTVTISNGEFSVLLGNGIDAVYNAVTETPTKTFTPLEAVFTSSGASRYVEIVVDNGDNTLNTTDAAISPRQQITSTAYSFRARAADTITSGTDLRLNDSSYYGLGYYGSTRLFNGTAVDGPVLFGQAGGALGSASGGSKNIALRWNASGAVGIGSADLAGAAPTTKLVLQGDDPNTIPQQLNIRGNSDTNKRLLLGYNTNSSYGSLQSYNGASSAGTLALNASGGNVGIGTSSPGAKLEVAGAIVTQSNATLAGRGIGGGEMALVGSTGSPFSGKTIFGTDNTGWKYSIASKDGSAMEVDRLVVSDAGNVGIGTTSPGAKLDVAGDIKASGYTFAVPGDTDGGLFSPADGTVTLKTNAAERLRVDVSGNVGIGTITPSVKLDVAGDIKANGKSVPVAEENLRIIRGNVGSSGVKNAGAGFSVVRESVGRYKITYDVAFSSAPSVSAIPYTDLSAALPFAPPSESFTVTFSVRNVGYYDTGFSFIVMGPR